MSKEVITDALENVQDGTLLSSVETDGEVQDPPAESVTEPLDETYTGAGTQEVEPTYGDEIKLDVGGEPSDVEAPTPQAPTIDYVVPSVDFSAEVSASTIGSVSAGDSVNVVVENGQAKVLGVNGGGDYLAEQVGQVAEVAQYFYHDENGSHVSDSEHGETGNVTTIDSTGLNIDVDNTSIVQLKTTGMRLGAENASHISIDNDSFDFVADKYDNNGNKIGTQDIFSFSGNQYGAYMKSTRALEVSSEFIWGNDFTVSGGIFTEGGAVSISHAVEKEGLRRNASIEVAADGQVGQVASGIYLNSRQYPINSNAPQRLLLSTGAFMNASQNLTLAEPISEQLTGVVLAFSFYSGGAKDWGWNYHFVPKWQVMNSPGQGIVFPLYETALFGNVGMKYLYISDISIKGHANNVATGTGASGITYKNNAFVLRYVIGV